MPFTAGADEQVPVLIAGDGGAGLTSSMLLARLGVDHLLVSARPQTSDLPKAHVLNQRAMEVLEDVGVASAIAERSTPPEQMAATAFYAGFAGPGPDYGRRLARLESWGAGGADENWRAASPWRQLNLPQIRLEPLLKARAEELSPGRIRFGHELTGLEQDGQGVRAEIRDNATGRQYAVRCQYLIGADGVAADGVAPVYGSAHQRTMRRASCGGQPCCTSRATWCQSRWSASTSASGPGMPSWVSRATRQLCTSSFSSPRASWAGLGWGVMIGSFTLDTEFCGQSCNTSSIMITMVSRAGLAESGTPGEQGSEAKGTAMFKSLSTSLIVRGILAVAVGIIALAWPSVTVLALVILFAIYAFMAAGLQAAQAFSSRTAGPVIGHLLLGLVDLAAGIIALAWPGPTALVLVLIVGVWAIVAGLVEIAAAFGHGEAAGTRALFILGGLITVAFGVVLCARPGIGAVTLALLFGLFSLIAGIWMLVQGIELRHAGKTLDPAAREKTSA
jgi:uncharacterized membrane protein HdeD (DUF308 family)